MMSVLPLYGVYVHLSNKPTVYKVLLETIFFNGDFASRATGAVYLCLCYLQHA